MLFDSQKQLLNENFHVTNNPYAYIDPDGKNPLLITAAIGAGAGAVIGGGISAYIQYRDTGSVNLADGGKAESLKTLNAHVFENRPVGGKSLLPKHSDSKYYMAYDINVPGTTNRGTQRFVIGKNGERYYTKDHYKSFNKVSG